MNLSGVIDSFATGTYTITRAGTGIIGAAGRLEPSAPTTFTRKAVVQPLSGREQEMLEEGLRNNDSLNVWTTEELRTAEPGAGVADIITIDGDDYEVQKVERWDALGAYWKHLVMKI